MAAGETSKARAEEMQISLTPPLDLTSQTLNNDSNPRDNNHQNHHPHPYAAATFIANNIDILEQIFLYLPPKSLIRFKSVSKTWYSVISNPTFRRIHSRSYSATAAATIDALFLFRWKYNRTQYNRTQFNRTLFNRTQFNRTQFNRTPSELNFISFSAGYVNPIANIVSRLKNLFDNGEILDFHSCNGLLSLVFKYDYGHLEFVVCNPTTREYTRIPQLIISPEIEKLRNFEALNIVFDPLKSDHYKLVYVWWEKYRGEYEFGYPIGRHGFSVYASETGIWRECADTVPTENVYLPTYFGNGVLWNGNLHWVSDRKYIICFELSSNCLIQNMPDLSNVLDGVRELRYFGESNDCLYLIAVNHRSRVLFDVFEMARDYSEWSWKYCIDLDPLTILYPSTMAREFLHPSDERPYFLEFLEDAKEGTVSLVISLRGKLILYNINDAVKKELAVGSFYQWKDAYRHKETLAYVN